MRIRSRCTSRAIRNPSSLACATRTSSWAWTPMCDAQARAGKNAVRHCPRPPSRSCGPGCKSAAVGPPIPCSRPGGHRAQLRRRCPADRQAHSHRSPAMPVAPHAPHPEAFARHGSLRTGTDTAVIALWLGRVETTAPRHVKPGRYRPRTGCSPSSTASDYPGRTPQSSLPCAGSAAAQVIIRSGA